MLNNEIPQKERAANRVVNLQEYSWCVSHIIMSQMLIPWQPASRVNCHIGFAQMAMNLPAPTVDDTVEILLGILDDIPDMDFDETLMWDSKFACRLV